MKFMAKTDENACFIDFMTDTFSPNNFVSPSRLDKKEILCDDEFQCNDGIQIVCTKIPLQIK